MKIRLIIAFVTLTFAMSCNLFDTRDPEEPDSGASNYEPPTSADIVISNFVSAIREKNTENYISCLYEQDPESGLEYEFSPTSSAKATYESIFSNWNIDAERNYFLSMVANMFDEINPELNLSGGNFESILPDSAVYVSDYYLKIDHNSETIPTEFSGQMRFTLKSTANGLWSIQKWIDVREPSDTIPDSWSNLKALFTN